jgi:hypothetical protein
MHRQELRLGPMGTADPDLRRLVEGFRLEHEDESEHTTTRWRSARETVLSPGRRLNRASSPFSSSISEETGRGAVPPLVMT